MRHFPLIPALLALLLVPESPQASLFLNQNRNLIKRPVNPADRLGDQYQGYEQADADGDGVADYHVAASLLSPTEIEVTLTGLNPNHTLSMAARVGSDPMPGDWRGFSAVSILTQSVALGFGTHTLHLKVSNRQGRTGKVQTKTFAFPNVVHVAPDGNDTLPGTARRPLRTIQKAVEQAVAQGGNTVYLAQGTYTRGLGLLSVAGGGLFLTNNNLHLRGGFDAQYLAESGTSVLDGGGAFRILSITGATNLRLSGMVLQMGSEPGGLGGGMKVSECAILSFSNFTCRRNTAAYGGGAHFSDSTRIQFFGILSENEATMDAYSMGGGLYLSATTAFTLSADSQVYGNLATHGGGMAAATGSYDFTNLGRIYGNRAASNGGGVVLQSSASRAVLSGPIFGNTAGLAGGGLYAWSATDLQLSGDLYGNTVTRGAGGGAYLWQSSYANITSRVYQNNAVNNGLGGGLFLRQSHSVTSTSAVYENNGGNGVGIYMDSCNDGRLQVILSNQGAGNWGGGFYGTNLTGLSLQGLAIGNRVSDNGSAIYLEYSGSNLIQMHAINHTGLAGTIFVRNNRPDSNLFVGMVVTNNYVEDGSAQFVFDLAVTNQPRLLVSGCVIGGQGTGAYGIQENLPVTNHQILSNRFVTNTLAGLYANGGGGTLGNEQISVLNTSLAPGHEALLATGNTTSNR